MRFAIPNLWFCFWKVHGKEYYIPPALGTSTSFDVQQDACRQAGGQLAVVLTKEDADALREIGSLGKEPLYSYFGLKVPM